MVRGIFMLKCKRFGAETDKDELMRELRTLFDSLVPLDDDELGKRFPIGGRDS
jgi:hypothetical protein